MTDYYIAKAGVSQGGQDYAEVIVAPSTATVTHSNRVGGATYSWACVYNTPSEAFDSIKMRAVRNTTGHITTLSVYSMGAIPDDPNTSEDNAETDRVLRTDLLVASATHTQVVDNSSGVDVDVVFDFNTTLSQANLGAAFTVVQSTTDANGVRVASSELRFDDRDALYHFINPNDNQSSDSNVGGAGNMYYQTVDGGYFSSYTGAQVDPCLAFELYHSTSIPLGNDSNNGLAISTPKATVNSIQTAYDFTSADKLFFRAGTYTTELAYGPVSEVNIYMEFDAPNEHISIEAYGDETVVFEMPVNEQYLLGLNNVNGSSNDDVYTIKNIQFKNGATTAASQGFVYLTQSNSSTTFCKFVIDGCTFTQLGTEIDLVRGGVYAGITNIGSVEIRNCEFNIVDVKAITLSNQIKAVIENNTFNLIAPATNDDRLAMFSLSGRQNAANSQVTKLFFSNNIVNYTFSDGMNGDTILVQPEYFNEMHFFGNTFNFETTDIQSNRIIDTIRPATTTIAGRTTSIINIIGNTFNNNTGRGDTIEFYRSPLYPENTAVVNVNYNTFVGNAEMQNNLNNQVLDTTNMKATEFNCIGNIFEKYQDFLLLNDMQNTPFVIEDNIFKNGGNNNFGSAGDTIPLSVYIIESNGGTIKNNTFFIEEEGTCIRLHVGVTNDVTIEGNSFVYLGAPRTNSEEYIIININPADLDEVTIDNNYYYGLEKLGDTTLFEYAPTATFDEAMALADTDITFHTTNIIKRDVAKSMTSRLTKEVAWKV